MTTREMCEPRPGLRRLAAMLLLGALAAASPAALGGSHTWSGAGANGNWSNAANWSAGGAPVNGESVVLSFPAGQGHMGSMNNDRTGLTVTSMTFQESTYALGGNAFNLNGTISVTGGTVMYNHVGINVDVVLTGSSWFSSGSDPGTGNFFGLSFNHTISGAAGKDIHIQSQVGATGEVVFAHANTYDGVTYVHNGYLHVDDPGALGSTVGATIVDLGGTLSVNRTGSGSWVIAGETLFVGGPGVNGNSALQWSQVTWTGSVTLTEDTAIHTDGTVIASGVVSGPWALTVRSSAISGNGELDLTGPNTYSGPNWIEYGTVVVNGSQPASNFTIEGYDFVTVSRLRGTGTVGAVTMQQGGSASKVVAPGTTTATGTLHTGDFVLNDPPDPGTGYAGNHGVLSVRLGGTTPGSGYDQVAVNGIVDVTDATLQVNLWFTPAVGNSFVIVANDGAEPVAGTFRVGGVPIPSGGTFTVGGTKFSINYAGGTGNDIVITAVPAGSTHLYTLPSCRIFDTRVAAPGATSGAPSMSANEVRTFDSATMTRCAIPADASAIFVNVTAVGPAADGYLSLYPGGFAWPGTSSISFPAGKNRANNAVVPLGSADDLTVKNGSNGTVDVVLDVTGYFK